MHMIFDASDAYRSALKSLADPSKILVQPRAQIRIMEQRAAILRGENNMNIYGGQ